jgi:hypothetical protein
VIHTELAALTEACSVPVFVSGEIAQSLAEPLRRAGAAPLPPEAGKALAEIDTRLARIS